MISVFIGIICLSGVIAALSQLSQKKFTEMVGELAYVMWGLIVLFGDYNPKVWLVTTSIILGINVLVNIKNNAWIAFAIKIVLFAMSVCLILN